MDTAETDKENIALNDMVGDKPIVILHQRGSRLTSAFSRRFRGKTLRFATDKDGRFVDLTHHSHWNFEGEAVDGSAAGQKLSYVPSQVEDWYIWAAFHSATSIYQGANAANQGGPAAANRGGPAAGN
jgi:hypothetical protein